MKIATFNVNSIRARLPIVLKWIEIHQPDILAVQETKVQDHDFPVSDFESLSYHCYYSGQKSYNGVALISRHVLSDVSSGFPDSEPADASRLIRARLSNVHIVNTYVPQGQEIDSDVYQYKLNWYRRLNELFERYYSPSTPVIWLGDLNVAPENIDVYDPKGLEGHVCFNRGLSEVFKASLKWGFTDILRKYHPEPGCYTFFDYRLGSIHRNHGWRIDHILVTEPLEKASVNSWIDLEPRQSREHKPSDHTVLSAEFNDSVL